MLANAAVGEMTDGGEGPFELAEMQTWGEERTVRAAVIRHLLVADEWPADPKGAWLRGVRIAGHLDVAGATLRCAISLQGHVQTGGV